jgi:hypothetical protein
MAVTTGKKINIELLLERKNVFLATKEHKQNCFPRHPVVSERSRA